MPCRVAMIACAGSDGSELEFDDDQRIPPKRSENAGSLRGVAVMEFHIKTQGLKPDLDAINDALIAIDPMAMADIDPEGTRLRVAVELGSPELLALLTRAGYPVDWRQLEQVPSVCCGACGG